MIEIIGAALIGAGVGFLAGVAISYPIGRRHGIEALAERWRAYNRTDRVTDDALRRATAAAHRTMHGEVRDPE